MSDNNSEIYFCICGKKIDKPGTCGNQDCIESYDDFKKKIDDFFIFMETSSIWEGYKLFETMERNLQVRLLFELEDTIMLLFLQALGAEKVLELLESKSEALRYRMLELLEPMLEKEIMEEFKHLSELEQENVKELLLNIVNIVLQTVQKESK